LDGRAQFSFLCPRVKTGDGRRLVSLFFFPDVRQERQNHPPPPFFSDGGNCRRPPVFFLRGQREYVTLFSSSFLPLRREDFFSLFPHDHSGLELFSCLWFPLSSGRGEREGRDGWFFPSPLGEVGDDLGEGSFFSFSQETYERRCGFYSFFLFFSRWPPQARADGPFLSPFFSPPGSTGGRGGNPPFFLSPGPARRPDAGFPFPSFPLDSRRRPG